MARLLVLLLVLVLVLLSTAKEVAQTASSGDFPVGPTKISHLHFFFHDVLSGKDPSAINMITSPVTKNNLGFGATYMIDDLLTETSEPTSKVLGRAQGFYSIATKGKVGEEFALLMNVNFVFVEGEFNGSSLAILGRNNALASKRELPVVGGSGRFRMARGYATLRTHSLDRSTGDAVIEYDVYVQHHGASGAGVGKESVAGGVVGGSGRKGVFALVPLVCYLLVFLLSFS